MAFLEEVSVSFVAKGGFLFLADSFSEELPRTILLHVQVADGIDIFDQDKQSLRRLDWRVRMIEAAENDPRRDDAKAIGYLNHSAAVEVDFRSFEASIVASVHVRPKLFDWVYECLLANRVPGQISINVRGIGYGAMPDGSNLMWDIEKVAIPQVVGISIAYPITVDDFPFDKPQNVGGGDSVAANASAGIVTASASSPVVSIPEQRAFLRTARAVALMVAGILLVILLR